MKRNQSGLQPLVVVVMLTVLGTALWLALGRGWFSGPATAAVRGASVQRGPLRISVTERGNLKAADSIALKSEIEGQTTILKLVAEGTMVEEGDVLCELDATGLIDQRFQQEISLRNAEAAFVKSKQNYEIQKSQNDSDVKRAEQALFFAEMDLRKFQEGEKRAQEAEADEAIKIAEEEATRAGEKLDWSQKLNEKGFLTDTELEADRLSLSRAEIQLEQSKRDKDLLVRFQLPRDEADLVAKLDEARRELERVKLQAAARIVDFEADMNTNEAKLRLEREKLLKVETQIAKSKLIAPRAGMVVYAVEEGGRYGSSQPIKEGTQVRERQEIITIPSAAGMIAQVSLHESVLKQVEPGQAAIVRVDAIPGREFHGRVRFVAVMADQNSFWANPNLRLYRTEVAIDDAVPEMRPGMSCAIEILVEEIPDTLFVPVQSIFRRGQETLAFVERGGTSEQRGVAVGRYNDRWVQVLDGLAEGEVVLLAPPVGFSREVESASEPETGAGPRPEASPTAVAREGGPAVAPGGGLDPARAEEMRKRFEGMSEEERARAMESFRARRGEEDGSREGGERGHEAGREGGREGGERSREGGRGGEPGARDPESGRGG
ncbi:MAG TPA: efflux RND transporter periplasmic adaptor subunit [Planctomycetota bacterium]